MQKGEIHYVCHIFESMAYVRHVMLFLPRRGKLFIESQHTKAFAPAVQPISIGSNCEKWLRWGRKGIIINWS